MYVITLHNPRLTLIISVGIILFFSSLSVLLYSIATRSISCDNYSNHREAQNAYEKDKIGMSGLDKDSDGIACEGLK